MSVLFVAKYSYALFGFPNFDRHLRLLGLSDAYDRQVWREYISRCLWHRALSPVSLIPAWHLHANSGHNLIFAWPYLRLEGNAKLSEGTLELRLSGGSNH